MHVILKMLADKITLRMAFTHVSRFLHAFFFRLFVRYYHSLVPAHSLTVSKFMCILLNIDTITTKLESYDWNSVRVSCSVCCVCGPRAISKTRTKSTRRVYDCAHYRNCLWELLTCEDLYSFYFHNSNDKTVRWMSIKAIRKLVSPSGTINFISLKLAL